jgi:hypothetical protein
MPRPRRHLRRPTRSHRHPDRPGRRCRSRRHPGYRSSDPCLTPIAVTVSRQCGGPSDRPKLRSVRSKTWPCGLPLSATQLDGSPLGHWYRRYSGHANGACVTHWRGIPHPLGEDRPLDYSEGTGAHVAIRDFKTFVANSESESSRIATRMRVGVAEIGYAGPGPFALTSSPCGILRARTRSRDRRGSGRGPGRSRPPRHSSSRASGRGAGRRGPDRCNAGPVEPTRRRRASIPRRRPRGRTRRLSGSRCGRPGAAP